MYHKKMDMISNKVVTVGCVSKTTIVVKSLSELRAKGRRSDPHHVRCSRHSEFVMVCLKSNGIWSRYFLRLSNSGYSAQKYPNMICLAQLTSALHFTLENLTEIRS